MMVSRALLPPKHHFVRLLRPGFAVVTELRAVAWQRRRLLGTAAAREVPIAGRTSKRVSKEMRKAMVEEYVSKYRAMNGGKFPSASVIKKEVGGGYYNVRAILQELEFKLSTMETKDENSIAAGRTDKVNGISPLSSKEVEETSEVGEVLNSEVLLGTTKVQIGTTISTSYRISADNCTSCERESSNNTDERVIDKSIVPHCNVMSIEDENSGQTAKVTGTYEVREVLDNEVQVGTTSASNDVEILVDGGTSSQGEVSNNSGHMMVDTTISNSYIEASMRYEGSTVGQTDKTNGISEVREVIDSEVQVGTSIVSGDSGILAADGSSSQGEGSNNSGQTTVDTSNMTNYNEVSAKDAKDETWIVGQTDKFDGISEEGSEFPSKPGYYPSEALGACRSTDFGKIDETSSQASESDQLSREKNQNEAQKTSIWGNLKSFASSIISIWRR